MKAGSRADKFYMLILNVHCKKSYYFKTLTPKDAKPHFLIYYPPKKPFSREDTSPCNEYSYQNVCIGCVRLYIYNHVI